MFKPHTTRVTRLRTAFGLMELIFHATVRNLRKSHGNAAYGLLMSVVQSALVLTIFVVMFQILGLRRVAIPGDFILFVMSGVFMFLTHTKAVGAVSGADSPTSTMMMHAPMNPVVAVVAAALASLYQQTFSAIVIMFAYHALFEPIHIHDPVGMLGFYLLSWFSGAAIGLIFYAAKPWQPDLVGMLSMIYQRANMIASGKMFPASYATAQLRSYFDWNPLYHTIDQGRAQTFLNYTARYTSIEYPIYIAFTCILIGLMAQFFTRKNVSLSWGKSR